MGLEANKGATQTGAVRVVIATVNRPGMLRQALQSVMDQTARERIGTVLVSENGGGQESRQVCAEFPGLPIQYVFRQPATNAFEHGRRLFAEPFPEPYTAILHDDDWWLPEHLAEGLRALDDRPAAMVCYSSFYENSDQAGIMASGSWHFYWWFGAGFPALASVWELNLPEIAAASFLRTAGHYSSLLARSGPLQQAFDRMYAVNNPYDNDRLLLVLLAEQGAVLYRPFAGVVVRLHPGQDARGFHHEQASRHMLETTEWIANRCQTRGIDLAALVAGRIRQCPAEARERLDAILDSPWCVPAGRQMSARFPELAGLVPESWRSDWRVRAKALARAGVPPFLAQFGKAVLRR